MNKFSVALAALIAAVPLGAARSADMPLKAPPPAPPHAATWTGCYLGVEAGYGWLNKIRDNVGYQPPLAFGEVPYTQTADAQGGMGGVQVGCDYQWGSQWVVGVIATYDFSSISGSSSANQPFGAPIVVAFPHTFSEDIDGFGTVRGRIGWLFAPNWLVYGSGGLAYGRIITSANANFGGGTVYIDPGEATWKTGWTAGGGVEWKFSNHISVFGEYLYAELGNVTGRGEIDPTFVPGTSVTDGYGRHEINVLKGGVNWRF